LAPQTDPLITRLYTSITSLGYTPQYFTTESDLESYVRSSNYPNNPQMCFGIVVDSSTGTYQYKLRFNMTIDQDTTDGPLPTTKLTQDQSIDLKIYNRSIFQGMIGASTLVNTAIYQKETSTSNILKHSIAPIYQ
jgi:hypothetical protein